MLGMWGSARPKAARRLRGGRLVGIAALVACLMLTLGAASASALEDFSGGAYQILAPGAEGNIVPGPFSNDQGTLYDKLTSAKGGVSQAKLEKDFISEKFGVQGSTLLTETPEAGLEIKRDSHDVAHVFGETRAEVMFGSGWVGAKDRGLLLKLGLGPAYTAALDVPGVNPFGLLLQGRSFTPSKEAKEYVEKQLEVLKGPKGEQTISDLEAWVAGVNAYEATLPEKSLEKFGPVTLTDAIAGFAFIGSIFGNGGGAEVQNSNFLASLESKLGTEEGLKVYRDLRETNDPETPTTASKPFPYDQAPTGPTPAGAVVIDPGSPGGTAIADAAATKASRRKASNFLLAGASRTRSGHPVAVMGPQLGYFYPEIVFQADLHGPGIDASGVVAPISPYVFIGRGRDFAWSLTSAGSENTQTFLVQLCNPKEEEEGPPTRKSTSYVYKGECIPMKKVDAGLLGAQGAEPAHELEFEETVYGPEEGTVLVGGKPYGVAKDRSTRGREPAGEIAFNMLDSDEVHSPADFFEAANHLETTFNMAYLDNEHIAYFSTGRLPVLAAGTDPSLPTLGNGEFDWQGFLSLEQHPHEVDPASGMFLNWNNKPAPEWGAASDEWSEGPIHRVQLYTGFTNRMTEAKDATVMNRAATKDLRAVKVWPVIEKVLATGPAPSKLAEEVANEITAWVSAGASRFGKTGPKAPAAAAMDAVWAPIAEAVLSPVLGSQLGEFKSIAGIDNPENSGGSSFGGGWYGYVEKDLRTVLGESVAQPYSRTYCGNGSLEACRNSLWSAIQTAAEGVAAKQGSNPATWEAARVRIEFPPDPVEKFTMRWTNRSTFQQVIEFTGHAP